MPGPRGGNIYAAQADGVAHEPVRTVCAVPQGPIIETEERRVLGGKRPRPVLHALRFDIRGLPARTGVIGGTHDAHTLVQLVDVLAAQQTIDGLGGQLRRSEVRRGAITASERGNIALACGVTVPTFAAATNHDPAATVHFLIAEEFLRRLHLRGEQPVGAVLGIRVVLFNSPTGRGSSVRAGPVPRDDGRGVLCRWTRRRLLRACDGREDTGAQRNRCGEKRKS